MRWLAFAGATLLLLGAWVAPGLAQNTSQQKKKVQGLRQKLKGVQGEKSDVRKDLREAQQEVSVASVQLQEVDQRLTALDSKIEYNEERLGQLRTRLVEAEKDLRAARDELAQVTAAVRRRIRQIYIAGDQDGLIGLLSAQDLGELAARKFVLERLAERDRLLFEKFQAAEDRVERRRADQLLAVQEQKTVLATLEEQRAEVEAVRKEKAGILAKLQKERNALQREVNALDAESRSIEREIRRIQDQMANAGGATRFTGRFIRPVNGRISSGFGYRIHPVLRTRRLHAGIDFAAPTGTPIRASAAGVVIGASYRGGYGNTVVIDHGGGISTLYGHCSRLFVRNGERVRQGQKIAAVGSTGLSTGPHLHFEIRVNGRPVNPAGRL